MAVTIPGLSDLVEVGRGGFAIVYRARQEAVGRVVAVKVLAALDLDSDQQRRFRQECRAMGTLSSHPNIVQVFDAGTSLEGLPYIAMEFMPGQSLWQRVKVGGPLSIPELFAVGVPMAGALETAHRAGILHRDIKPDNILLDTAGAYRLTDFGIAAINDGTRSLSGAVAGTIAYLPPEVVRGERSTEQSDVYELGATLHAAACASVPFRRPTDENPVSALARILTEAPADLGAFGVPASLAQVIGIAMAKDPAARYRSAAAFGEALIEVQRSLGLPQTRMVVLGDSSDDTVASLRAIAPPPTSEGFAATAANALPTTLRQPAAASPTYRTPEASMPAGAGVPRSHAGRTIAMVVGGLVAAVVVGAITIVALNARTGGKVAVAATTSAPIIPTTSTTNSPASTVAAAAQTTVAPTLPATVAPVATTPVATTATPPVPAIPSTTAARATSAPTVPAPLAVQVARSYATAVATHDWNAARALNPSLPDDATLDKGYGYLNEQLVVDAVTTPSSNNLNDVRLLVLAHEAPPAGEQTSFWCFHWRVDAIAHTVKSVDGKRLQTYPGTLDASATPSELVAACQSLDLK